MHILLHVNEFKIYKTTPCKIQLPTNQTIISLSLYIPVKCTMSPTHSSISRGDAVKLGDNKKLNIFTYLIPNLWENLFYSYYKCNTG